jgi:hypothetical protein
MADSIERRDIVSNGREKERDNSAWLMALRSAKCQCVVARHEPEIAAMIPELHRSHVIKYGVIFHGHPPHG